VVEENPGEVVNMRLFNKLSYRPPGRLLVNRYLVEIADVYKVEWEPPIGKRCAMLISIHLCV
jgi:hypothetical protein